MGNTVSFRRRRQRNQEDNPEWMAAMNFSRHKSISVAELARRRRQLAEELNGKTESTTPSSTSTDEILSKNLPHEQNSSAWIPEMHVPARKIEIIKRSQNDEDVASQVDALFAYWYTRSKPEAFWILGSCHYRGIGVSRDPKEAVVQWEKAAAQGHRDSMYAIGATLFNGECEDASRDEQLRQAASWFQKASDLGDTDATSALAVCYQLGMGVEKDMAKAAESYLANMPFGHLYLLLDRIYRKFELPLIDNKFHQHDEDEILKLRIRANKLSEKLRQKGDKALDSTLDKFSSIPQSRSDCEEALKQFLPDLLNERPEALYCLGEIHQYLFKETFSHSDAASLRNNGRGEDELKRERCWHHAFRLFLLAAEMGHPRAVFRVGQILAESKTYESLFLEDACFLMDSATIFHRSKNETKSFPCKESFFDSNSNRIHPYPEQGGFKIERYYLEQEESHLLRLGIQW